MNKEQGRDTARTADPSWPKSWPIPYGVMHSNNSFAEKNEGRKKWAKIPGYESYKKLKIDNLKTGKKRNQRKTFYHIYTVKKH